MSRGRAFRRHQARLAKRRAFFHLYYRWGFEVDWITPARVGQLASTHCCPCSCQGCGNMRRLYGPTWPERRADVAWREQVDEALS